MRKLLILIILAFVLGGSLFAQQGTDRVFESGVHYFNVSIERIFAHRLGFIVVYRRGPFDFARTFIPQEWFTDLSGRGEMIRIASGREWPSLSVFYQDGEFTHVRLRVRRSRAHETWGVVPQAANIDEYFAGIEDIRLEF